MMKWIIAIIVVLVIAGAGAGLYMTGSLNKLLSWSPQQTPTQAQPQQQATTTAQAPQTPTDLPTGTSDSTDTALAQDATAIDAQMQGFATDSANVDSSLNDKPVSQEY